MMGKERIMAQEKAIKGMQEAAEKAAKKAAGSKKEGRSFKKYQHAVTEVLSADGNSKKAKTAVLDCVGFLFNHEKIDERKKALFYEYTRKAVSAVRNSEFLTVDEKSSLNQRIEARFKVPGEYLGVVNELSEKISKEMLANPGFEAGNYDLHMRQALSGSRKVVAGILLLEDMDDKNSETRKYAETVFLREHERIKKAINDKLKALSSSSDEKDEKTKKYLREVLKRLDNHRAPLLEAEERANKEKSPDGSPLKDSESNSIPTSIPRVTFQQAQEWAKGVEMACTLVKKTDNAFSFSGQGKDKKQIRFEFHNGKDGDPATLKLEKNAPFETYEKMASFAQANKGKILDVSQLEGKDKILAFIAAKQEGLEVRGVTPEEIHRHQKAALKAIGPNHSGYAKAETLLKKELAKKSPEEVVRVKSPSPGGQN